MACEKDNATYLVKLVLKRKRDPLVQEMKETWKIVSRVDQTNNDQVSVEKTSKNDNAPREKKVIEDEEIEAMFGKKKRRVENASPEDNIAMYMVIWKRKPLQHEFLDHGVLTLLKNWLEPLPDGSIPNIVIRTAILEILTDYLIDLEQFDRREQLKKSGIGKVIMFLLKFGEESNNNRRLAQNLVNKWSRPIVKNTTARYADVRREDKERVVYSRPSKGHARLEYKEVDLCLSQLSERDKPRRLSSMQHAVRPELMAMDFVVRPLSKINLEEIRARAGQIVSDQRRLRVSKNLQNLKS
ncbi:hypothetical protein IFM89_039200 [Coptis chinensis]|uniref:TFIIS N-terminal domain-containing protein n=1 Tax=Coptis chinensis TaxID=261450 RepID=A0A835IAM0_9MAGN|nr:hypothetical protein IFM89_039200 [Coptis chinensis]